MGESYEEWYENRCHRLDEFHSFHDKHMPTRNNIQRYS